ncbi:MAG: hypothetical protein M3463_01970 [Verrucomicrobiota bacterium]|nr:hypothetical protein [Verrucomicrobiota bacterium]
MRTLLWTVPALLMGTGATKELQAQPVGTAERREAVQWLVQAELQAVVLPQEQALALLPQLTDEKQAAPALAKIQEMITANRAKLVGSMIAKTKGDEKAVVRSGEEVRYGTEFDSSPELEFVKPAKADQKPAGERFVLVPATAFETRYAGVMLEAVPSVLKDGETIELDVKASHVRLLGFRKIECGITTNGTQIFYEQPQFHTMSNEAVVQLRSDQRILLGIHKVPEQEGGWELFLIKASAQKASAR